MIDTKLFSRPKKDKDLRARAKKEVELLKSKYSAELNDLRATAIAKLVKLLDGKTCQGIKHKFGEEIMSKGVKIQCQKH